MERRSWWLDDLILCFRSECRGFGNKISSTGVLMLDVSLISSSPHLAHIKLTITTIISTHIHSTSWTRCRLLGVANKFESQIYDLCSGIRCRRNLLHLGVFRWIAFRQVWSEETNVDRVKCHGFGLCVAVICECSWSAGYGRTC